MEYRTYREHLNMPSTNLSQSDVKTQMLTIPEVLDGYDAVARLYPHIPPLSHWRAWEYASYKHQHIEGRILDIGCGDGQYFKLIWPDADNVAALIWTRMLQHVRVRAGSIVLSMSRRA